MLWLIHCLTINGTNEKNVKKMLQTNFASLHCIYIVNAAGGHFMM